MNAQNKLLAIVGGAAATVAFSLAYLMFRPKPAVVEVAAPAVIQKDGSLILEKVVDATAKPKQTLPKGSKVVRIDQVTAAPVATAQTNGGSPEGKAGPAAVTIDLTQVKMDDGQTRVIVSSPDGTILGGKDIIVEQPKVQAPPKHHLTGGYNGTGYLLGYSQKLIGPVDVGAIATFEPLKTEKFRAYATVTISW